MVRALAAQFLSRNPIPKVSRSGSRDISQGSNTSGAASSNRTIADALKEAVDGGEMREIKEEVASDSSYVVEEEQEDLDSRQQGIAPPLVQILNNIASSSGFREPEGHNDQLQEEEEEEEEEEYNPRKLKKPQNTQVDTNRRLERFPHIINFPTPSDTPSSSTAASSAPIPPTENGLCDPISWAKINLFDARNNVPLPREIQAINVQKFLANPQQFDRQSLLRLAASFAKKGNTDMRDTNLAMAAMFSTVNGLISQLQERTPSNPTDFDPTGVVPKRNFDLDMARSNEQLVFLPSGRSFLPSDAVQPEEVINFTSTSFFENSKSIVRLMFGKIAYKDPYFVAFSPTPNARFYLPLDDSFYKVVVSFLIDGFQQKSSPSLRTATTKLVVDSFNNFADRLRKKHNKTFADTAEEVARKLKQKIAEAPDDLPSDQLIFDDITSQKLKQFLSG